MMGFDTFTPFLLADIPADVALVVASACGTPLITAIAVLYRRQIVLEDRVQANVERVAQSAYASADAMNKLAASIERVNREVAK